MAQQNLYYRTQLDTTVSLLPDQINGNIDDNILINLKAKIEKKATEHGIILNVTKLINYSIGKIDRSNFMGTTIFPVKYECFVCSPIKNLEIVCRIENIIKGYIIGINGPIIIAIQFNEIDTQNFENRNNAIHHIKSDKPIQKSDYIKVSIINISNNKGEKNITVICKLLNMATKDEIQAFQRDQLLVSGDLGESESEMI